MNGPSIRRSLLVRTGIGVGLLLCLLSTTTYLLVRHGLYEELDASIEQTAALLANQVELENGAIIFEWQEGIGTNPLANDEGLFQYWNESTGETTRSPAMSGLDLPKFHGPQGKPELRDIQLPGKRRHARALGMTVYPFVLPEELVRMKEENRVIDPKALPHVLVVARDAKPVHRILTRLRWILGLGTTGTLALGWLLVILSVRSSLRPIDHLAHLIRKRTTHNLDDTIHLPKELPEELVGLAEDFDSLLARVAVTRSRERDFIRNAAHELRTPIAGLQATAELALSKPRDAEVYAQCLETCRKTCTSLGTLVNRLFMLARIGKTSEPLHRVPIDLAMTLNDCMQAFTQAMEERGIQVDIATPDIPRQAWADPTLVKVILNNLLDNALSYGSFPGPLRICFPEEKDSVGISIANRADPFPDDLQRLFEPFFRKNNARDDNGAHLGIGLTLSLESALAMEGSLTASKSGDHWLVFTLMLPGKPI